MKKETRELVSDVAMITGIMFLVLILLHVGAILYPN